jgi:flagellar basal body-associated protein FliL
MSDQKASSPKEKKSIVSILKLVATILGILVFIFTAVSNMVIVYIVLAPDDLPKPFYLVYYLPGEEPQLPVASASESSETTGNEEHYSSGETGSETPTYSYAWDNIQPGQGIILDTGTKIVNLAEPGGKKYIRTNVVLEFAPNDPVYFSTGVEESSSSGGHGEETTSVSASAVYETEFLTELEARMPVINDSIITLLATKDFEDVYTAEGKDTLRNEIMAAVNSRLPEYHVIYVYFTEFVMQ